MDKERFKECCSDFKYGELKNSIGTYKEKSLHRIVKNYYNSNIEFQEIKINGFIADICENNQIIEIQTRAFNKLYDKLQSFCVDYDVKVVYPIPYNKWLVWVDNDTGEVTKRRKSPKTGNLYDAFYELYKIKKHLNNPHFHLVLLFINIDEYRNLNGWSENRKRGSSREEQIPLELIDEVEVNDFSLFLPQTLEKEFTSKQYAKAINSSIYIAQLGINILQYCNVIEKIGKDGRLNIYRNKKSD